MDILYEILIAFIILILSNTEIVNHTKKKCIWSAVLILKKTK